ncbi:MAG: TauD/TfdA family dioxygenase [Magnetococcus sp. WYHC-3]
MPQLPDLPASHPFSPSGHARYRQWRDARLAARARCPLPETVDITDLDAAPGPEQLAQLRHSLAVHNMVLFHLPPAARPADPLQVLPPLLAALGVTTLDEHAGAGAEGQSKLAEHGAADARLSGYIPYTRAAINWHTDGYYHPAHTPIRTLALYCHQPAAQGGENHLLDSDLAYIHLRDTDADAALALTNADAMIIPEHRRDGRLLRPARPGPVLLFPEPPSPAPALRYTRRARHVQWSPDPGVQRGRELLGAWLDSVPVGTISQRLEAGWGVITRNVLHARSAFEDPEGVPPRQLIRARSFQALH